MKKTYIEIIAGLAVVIVCLLLSTYKENGEIDLSRPTDYSEEREFEIEAEVEGQEGSIIARIVLGGRKLKADEALTILKGQGQMLLEQLKGDNEDLMHVTGKLNMPSEIEEYGIDVIWVSDDEIIDSQGNVDSFALNALESRNVRLTALLTLGEYQMEFEIEVRVVLPELTTNEDRTRWLEARLKHELEKQEFSENIVLPSEIDGKNITYRNPSSKGGIEFIMLIPIGIFGVWWGKKLEAKQYEKKRRFELELDYCEIISKLTLLLGAGLTVRMAWERIVHDYRANQKQTGRRVVYEEMAITVNELAAGIPERLVYENFGKRCNISEYLKLGSLLEQNLLKGSKHLLSLLEEESVKAFEKRKNLAIKQGEEAGTKLLLPMGLELVAVMAIIVVPALTNF